MNDSEMPKDHVDDSVHKRRTSDERRSPEENIKSKAIWLRAFFMLVVAMLASVAGAVGTATILFQFFWVLLTGETKPEAAALGRQLAQYARDILLFMTFNTEQRPFPFDKDWPSVT